MTKTSLKDKDEILILSKIQNIQDYFVQKVGKIEFFSKEQELRKNMTY